MKRLPLLTLLCCAAAAQGSVWYRDTALPMLPIEGRSAQVLSWLPDPALASLERRIARVRERDIVWYRAWLASGVGGVPPYHPRLGLSEAEYRQYLQYLELRLLPSGQQVQLLAQQRGDTVVFMRTLGTEALAGMQLNLRTGVLTLPEGVSARPQVQRVFGPEDRTRLGNRQGYVWRFTEVRPDGSLILLANLSLWRLSNSQMVIAFQKEAIVGGRALAAQELYLLYD